MIADAAYAETEISGVVSVPGRDVEALVSSSNAVPIANVQRLQKQVVGMVAATRPR